jgi:hypothetical protein
MRLEARKYRRKPTNNAGIARFDGKECPLLLRDLSAAGARIRIVGAAQIPDRFRLIVPMEKIDKPCVVVWRRGSDCGVQFEA